MISIVSYQLSTHPPEYCVARARCRGFTQCSASGCQSDRSSDPPPSEEESWFRGRVCGEADGEDRFCGQAF